MDTINKTIYEIMIYINFNLYEHITLDILAEKYSYSKFYLHRKFKEIIGITLNEYIRNTRIESSIYFLFANPGTDISEIADYCGYSSSTYSREFKKLFNRSPKEWRNIYKKGTGFPKDSNICKNYQQFICYDDIGIPKEIKDISLIEIMPKSICVKIYYGNYYNENIINIWDEIKRKKQADIPFIGIPLNSPAVTSRNKCIYLLGFESNSAVLDFIKMDIDGGRYIKLCYQGLREKVREIYTWIYKFYMPGKALKYDYHVQFIEYSEVPDFSGNEITCKIYIPVAYS